MAPRLRPGRRAGADARRAVRRDLARAIDALADADRTGTAAAVHDARRRAKRARAVARLAEPAIGRRRRTAVEDPCRRAGRLLSELRDASAVLATWDELARAAHGRRPPARLRPVRARLAGREAAAGAGAPAAMAEARRLLGIARSAAGDWPRGYDAADLAEGLADAHRRGDRALRRLDGDDGRHRLRRRAKRERHQLEFLHVLAPSALGPMATTMAAIADALGDDHDLAVLRRWILTDAAELGEEAVAAAIELIDPARADLQDRAIRLAARAYAERPKALRRRVGRYAAALEALGPERPVAGIADLAREPADRIRVGA